MATTRGKPDPDAKLDRDPDILNDRELAVRLGIKNPKIIRDLAAAGELPGMQLGDSSKFLFRWTAVYAWLAGPGIPFGEILDVRGLAARLGIPELLVRRTAGAPGTPRRFPGRKIGGRWRFALEASRAAIAKRSQPEPSGDSVLSGT